MNEQDIEINYESSLECFFPILDIESTEISFSYLLV